MTAGTVGFGMFAVIVSAAAAVGVFMGVIVTAIAAVGVFVSVIVSAVAVVRVFVFSHFLLTFLSFFSFGFGLILRFGVQLDPDLPFLVAGAHNETILGRSLHCI